MIRKIPEKKLKHGKAPSIRRFLLFSLLIAMTTTTSVMVTWSYFGLKKQIEQLFEAQLIEGLKTVQAILGKKIKNQTLTQLQKDLDAIAKPLLHSLEEKPAQGLHYPIAEEYRHQYESQMVFQVWDTHDHKLLLHSALAPQEHTITSQDWTESGFGEKIVEPYIWLSFSQYDPVQEVQIIAAQRHDIRGELMRQITQAYLLPFALVCPILGLLIWLTVEQSFSWLREVSEEVRQRKPGHLQPIKLKGVPVEILPLIKAINHLFERLRFAFEKEMRFNADAAHELKTPLAGIRTQAQVALREKNTEARDNIIAKMIQGVDRATHIVEQLLTLSRYDMAFHQSKFQRVLLSTLLQDTIKDILPYAKDKNTCVVFKPPAQMISVWGDAISLAILIRNLLDNAIRYSPASSIVQVVLTEEHDAISLKVIDTGPGIPIADRQRVFERFYRQLGNSAPGSGLGLSIVHQIATLHHAELCLNTPSTGTGLEVEVLFPNDHKV